MKLSESTLIPLSLVITLLGGSAWITSLWAKTENNSIQIQTLTKKEESHYDKLSDKLDEVIERLARLEAKKRHEKE